MTQGVDEIQLLKEKVEALTEIVHNSNFVFIVRCRECRFYNPRRMACQHRPRGLCFRDISNDTFCIYGKRKEKGERKNDLS